MAKPQIKKVKKDSKGVTYYFSDDDGIMCVDIDVEPGVKSVVFQERQCASKWKSCYSRFLLRNVKKQFPDVERLIISGECIYTIDISNMMFPNVKEVIVKDNDSYEPGPYLMTAKDTNDGRKFCLLNTFCSDAGSVIDLKDVTEISSYAFEGCMAGKIINCKDVLIIDNSSFCGYPASMCENSYKDGALVFENMLVDIDAGAEHVTISEEVTISTSKWFNLSNVKEIVFQKMSTIPLVNGPNFNGTITINDDSFIPAQRDIDKIIRHIHCSAFKVTESNKQICAVDGVIYSKDKKRLLAYPRHRCGDFVIPDGTEIIYDNAGLRLSMIMRLRTLISHQLKFLIRYTELKQTLFPTVKNLNASVLIKRLPIIRNMEISGFFMAVKVWSLLLYLHILKLWEYQCFLDVILLR